ncbi:MAG: 3-hydroxyacyl-CoA dehydrogenase NAD-binding domain-containing protein [Mariniblastus sp.]
MPENKNSAVTTEQIRPDIVLITMDLPGSGANILNDQLFQELDQTMETLAKRTDLKGVILYSGKPKIFVAGADLKKIVATLDWPDKKIIEFCEKGRAVMARFSRCPFVSVAAIHGACVGGGLELALWCDCRIATSDRRTVLGLPEVKLGLVPGWAGTARLPRLSSFEIAADLVTSGRLVSSNEAKEMQFIDAVVEQNDLLDEAVKMIGRVRTSESFIRDRRAIMNPVKNHGDIDETVALLGKKIVANKEIFPVAPVVALEHMSRTALQPIKDAWDSESIAMSQVYGSPASRGLLNHFFLTDHNKKSPGLVDLSLTPNPIALVGIVGAGLMGSSIAETCIAHGISVVIHDAADGLAESVANAISSKSKPGKDATISAATDYTGLANVDLVIESVVETIDVKNIVLAKIEAAVGTNTIIASNTSAIPIEKMAATLNRPENFCGIHFCHPELMSLVEVICGPASAEQTIASAVGFVKSLRKMPVAINDGAGFVVNRLLGAMIDQALRLFAMGISIEEIDSAMRDFGFLGGPFEIVDVVGVETCMYAGRTMWEAGLRCVSISPTLPKLVKINRLGRKTGKGFYEYPGAPENLKGDAVWGDEVMDAIGVYRNDESKEQTKEVKRILDPENDGIAKQILSAMVLEATNILEEELVADHRDIDLCVIHGFSFPQHQGGVLFWADRIGLEQIQSELYRMGDFEERMRPNQTIKRMASNKSKFYTN